MAELFEVGDLVWAKLKSFPWWPGKVIQPKQEIKRPANKKPHHFVFFFGSENFAWVPEEGINDYGRFREQHLPTSRIPKGMMEAIGDCDEALKLRPPRPSPPPLETTNSNADLLSIEDELSEIHNDSKHGSKCPHKRGNEKQSSSSFKIKRIKKRSLNYPITHHVHPKKSRLLVKYTAIKSPSMKSMKFHKSKSSVQQSMDSTKPILNTLMAEVSAGAVFHSPPQSLPVPRVAGNSTNSSTKLGFLGLGTIGQCIVSNLLNAGHSVTIWNENDQKCREYMKEGALRGSTPADVVRDCDIIMSCVSSAHKLKEIFFGPNGLLQGIEPGKSYIEMSASVDVETLQSLNEHVVVRGGRFLEAPVCGTKEPATYGQLMVMAGGDRSLYDECRPFFNAIADKIYFLGAVGTGSKMKLLYHMLYGTIVGALAEVIALADKVDLDEESVMKVLGESEMASPLIKCKGQAMINKRFEPQFPVKHQQKDLRLGIHLADQVDQPLHIITAANELFKQAKNKGHADKDVAIVFKAADV